MKQTVTDFLIGGAVALAIAAAGAFVAPVKVHAAEDDPFGDGPPPPNNYEFKDTPTASWFKSLSSVDVKNCCDQSDCRKANSEWRGRPPYIDETGKLVAGEGAWWAQSNQTGQWKKVDDLNITKEPDGSIRYSIFDKAVLCEAVPPNDDAPQAQFFCFSPLAPGF